MKQNKILALCNWETYSCNTKSDFIKQNLQITKELNSILNGLILGDASISKTSSTSNARLEISFGQKYLSFAEHVALILAEFVSRPLKEVKIKHRKKVYINYRIKTKTLPIFNSFHDSFYNYNKDLNKYKKIVPLNICEMMDPIVLAYLIMTDGNFDKSRNRVRIYTNSFTKKEVESIALAIETKLGIYTGVLYDRKDQ
jgi:hypothetical protein